MSKLPGTLHADFIMFQPVFWKRSIFGLIFFRRFRFRQNVVVLLVAIPPTYLEAADVANRFRFRFQNPGSKDL